MEDIKEAIMRMQSAIMGIQENVEKIQQGQEVVVIEVKKLGGKMFVVNGAVDGIYQKVTTLAYDIQRLQQVKEPNKTVYDIEN